MNNIRIAKKIAQITKYSRREAEKLILERLVKINGKVIDTPVHFVSDEDKIEINNIKINNSIEIEKIYAFYKPKGLVCTNKDEQGRDTIFDYIRKEYPKLSKLIYIGRLDLQSEGLLLLTNNSNISTKLSSPNVGIVKTYKVRVSGDITQHQLDELANGVVIDGFSYKPIVANILPNKSKSNKWLEFKITEGKNREIRNICNYFNLKVSRLIRINFGPYSLEGMQPGDLIEVEIRKISKYLKK